MSTLHVKSFLNSIDFISKLFLLSPYGGAGAGEKKAQTWRSVTLSNAWVLSGLVFYMCVHLNYVMSTDNGGERVKLVTFFIDNYNRYSGMLMVTILVLIGYFRQATNREISATFREIEGIFERNLKVKIQNVNVLRIVYLQITIICGAVIFTEYSNCLMYIQPTTVYVVEENCVWLCILPMLVVAIVECRLFAYFLLIRERYKLLNQLISIYREGLNETKERIFYVRDFAVPPRAHYRHLIAVEKAPMKVRLIKSLRNLLAFLKCLLSLRQNRHSINDLDENAINRATINYIDRVMSIQTVYSRLHKIFNLVSAAYGMQIIAIIAVQFITLTTLMYYFTMKLVSLISPGKDIDRSELIMDMWSSGLWISIYMYKVYSLCYCIHITVDEGIKVGHYVHVFGLHAENLNDKLKIKMFLLQILQERIKFAPFGLFEINLGLFSMIFGAIATYILILIQFDVAQKT